MITLLLILFQIMTTVLLTILFPLYVLFIIWANNKSIPHSISDSWYILGSKKPILKYLLSKKINFETFLILDDILRFSKRLNKTISEKVLWPKLYDRMIRYKPFLSYNTTKYKLTLKKKVKEM